VEEPKGRRSDRDDARGTNDFSMVRCSISVMFLGEV
jgi:hypothetical protein